LYADIDLYRLTGNRYMTSEQHNSYLGYAFVAHGLFQLLTVLLFALLMLFFISLQGRPGETQPEFFGAVVGMALAFQIIFVLPSFVAAHGILKRKSWARVAALSAGLLSAINLPFGAAACIYSSWFFLGETWKTVYGGQPAQMANGLGGFNPSDVSRWSGYSVDKDGEILFQPVETPDWR
jgi:hypothetical protein